MLQATDLDLVFIKLHPYCVCCLFKATEVPEACDTKINNYLCDIEILSTACRPDVMKNV